LAYQVALGICRDLCRAIAWSIIAALASLHLFVLGFEDFVRLFLFCCGFAIYLQYCFQCLTLAAYVLLICRFIWTNLT
jgi:hypothetical protein